MDGPVTFRLGVIQELHRTRTERIRGLLRPHHVTVAAAPTAADYALAHHALEGTEAAARSHDVAAFDWYAAHPDAGGAALSIATSAGAHVVLAPDLAGLPRSTISETPYYLLGPDTAPATSRLRDLVADACALAHGAGFGELVTDHAVVICLLRRRPLGDTLDSWTITRLPGTVFCDHVGEPAVLARDLVHEAGHHWLNDALTATGNKISDDTQFFSPWKGTPRPAFGFLHASWAFPLTMLYTARTLPATSGDLRRFLTAYLAQQRDRLASTTEDHRRVLDLITDPAIRELLRAVHTEALAI